MSIAARIKALNLSELRAMERHGKRLDEIGKARQVNDTPALTFNGLDIVDAQAKHVAGCRINTAAQKICQHALIQFPTDIPVTEENQQAMLDRAVEFINHVYGGDAVFAARLDRDESGKHSVDVFFAPKYLKETAKTRRGEAESDFWISNTKHGKDLCHQHRDEITERNRQMAEIKRVKNEEAGRNVLIGPIKGTFSTGPAQVGIALQSELRDWIMRIEPEISSLIKPKKQKQSLETDRLEPEEYGLREDRAALEREREVIKERESKIGEREKNLKEKEISLNEREGEIEEISQKSHDVFLDAELKMKNAEKILDEAVSTRDRVINAHNAMTSFVKDIARKLGVSSSLSAIEAKVEELKKIDISSAKQQLIKAVFEKKRDQEIPVPVSNPDPVPVSNPDPVPVSNPDPVPVSNPDPDPDPEHEHEHVEDEDEDNDRDMSPSM